MLFRAFGDIFVPSVEYFLLFEYFLVIKSYQFWQGCCQLFSCSATLWHLIFPWETISLPVLCAANILCLGVQTQSSQGTNSHLGRVEPRRCIYCAMRNSWQASVGLEPRTSRSRVKPATTDPMRPIPTIGKLRANLSFISVDCYISIYRQHP